MLGFTNASFNASWLHNADIRLQTNDALYPVGNLLLQCQHLTHFIRITFRAELHLYLESIRIIDAVYHNQVMRFNWYFSFSKYAYTAGVLMG